MSRRLLYRYAGVQYPAVGIRRTGGRPRRRVQRSAPGSTLHSYDPNFCCRFPAPCLGMCLESIIWARGASIVPLSPSPVAITGSLTISLYSLFLAALGYNVINARGSSNRTPRRDAVLQRKKCVFVAPCRDTAMSTVRSIPCVSDIVSQRGATNTCSFFRQPVTGPPDVHASFL